MMYRHVAASENAFVQQLAVAYVNHGYWYYVTGVVPGHKEVTEVDKKLIDKYDIAISKWARARRKQQGLANMHYLRCNRFFVLIATQGEHSFFQEEGSNIKDVRREPVRFAGYSISYHKGTDQKWHASVRIHPTQYNMIKDYYVDIAAHRSVEEMRKELEEIPFEPYAPVRRQVLNILRAINRARHKAGFEQVPISALRLRRQILQPFTADQYDGSNDEGRPNQWDLTEQTFSTSLARYRPYEN